MPRELALGYAHLIYHGVIMIVLGLLLGIVGTDVNSGMARFTFGIPSLSDGIGFVVIAMGLFGFAEIVGNLEQSSLSRDLLFQKVKNLWPTWKDFKHSWNPMMRGTAIGAFFGILPGAGPTIASFSAYTLEKKVSKNAGQFGKGAIEGVASPEAANNSASQCEFIPTLAPVSRAARRWRSSWVRLRSKA